MSDEVVASGLELQGVLGVEGPGWLVGVATEGVQVDEQVLRIARDLEAEPCVVAVRMPLLAVARRPTEAQSMRLGCHSATHAAG